MERYIDAEILENKILDDMAKAEREGKDLNGYTDSLFHLKTTPTADVVPKSEVDNLEYTLLGVMHSVDKWLDGDELNQHEVNRAITMREKTLQIVERLQDEAKNLRNANAGLALALLYECTPTKEHLSELEKAVRDKVAMEIFEEIERVLHRHYHDNKITLEDSGLLIVTKHSAHHSIAVLLKDIAELKKKYTEDQK